MYWSMGRFEKRKRNKLVACCTARQFCALVDASGKFCFLKLTCTLLVLACTCWSRVCTFFHLFSQNFSQQHQKTKTWTFQSKVCTFSNTICTHRPWNKMKHKIVFWNAYTFIYGTPFMVHHLWSWHYSICQEYWGVN